MIDVRPEAVLLVMGTTLVMLRQLGLARKVVAAGYRGAEAVDHWWSR